MQTAQVLAGFSLGEADLLRRAMSKKNADVIQKEREKFIQGAVKLGRRKAVSYTHLLWNRYEILFIRPGCNVSRLLANMEVKCQP